MGVCKKDVISAIPVDLAMPDKPHCCAPIRDGSYIRLGQCCSLKIGD